MECFYIPNFGDIAIFSDKCVGKNNNRITIWYTIWLVLIGVFPREILFFDLGTHKEPCRFSFWLIEKWIPQDRYLQIWIIIEDTWWKTSNWGYNNESWILRGLKLIPVSVLYNTSQYKCNNNSCFRSINVRWKYFFPTTEGSH